MKERLDNILRNTLQTCFEKGALKKSILPDYVIEVPNNPNHGHYATNLPLTLASIQRKRPVEIAEILVENLADGEKMIDRIEIAGPGFINFKINIEEWYGVLSGILERGSEYGRSSLGQRQRVLVEFVSANPTGPLHLGHGRGAALGDTLCRILSFCDYDVAREFYINDAGHQIRLLGESIYCRWRQKTEPGYPFPENGYQGGYILDLAEEISDGTDLSVMNMEEAITHCADRGKEKMLEEIRSDLTRFRSAIDVWYKESELYSSGKLEASLEIIRNRGELYEKDGAMWIRTSAFGDDKDRVIRKKDGCYTYFASDISYHLDKWKRGFTKAINIWGADHHGYIKRVQAALKANDLDDEWLSVLLIQLVKLWEGGKEIKMSKRAGHFVSLKELVDGVGVDAVRFVFLTKNHDSPLDFDIDLVKKHDSDNPVYYVQYAHARISSIFRKAASEGISLPQKQDRLLDRLVLEEEKAIIRVMTEFPTLLKDICKTLEPHRLTYYLTDLASRFHRYFNLGTKIPVNRIVNQDRSLSQARLALVEAIRVVIHNGLNLLGIDAPERM